MKTAVLPRMTFENARKGAPNLDDYLPVWIEAFIVAKRAAGLSRNTVLYYTRKLRQFEVYCEAQAVKRVSELTPSFIREWLIVLEQGHNAGGRHAAFRAVRAFLLWYEHETDEVTAIRKVQPPRVSLEPLQGVSLADVLAMVKVSDTRDAAMLLCLLDTGCRAREFLAINLGDVDQATGEILVRQSKGQRPRHVYLGQTARKALRRYLKQREGSSSALWVSRYGDRLAYSSLRGMVVRRAKQAGIEPPALHDFRRGFALMYLRNGGDIFTLARLLGHKGIDVLRRYLAHTDQDAQIAHGKYSPVDSL